MKNWKDISYIAAIVAGVVVWAYTSFASIQYVDIKTKDAKEDLLEIKQDVKDVKAMVLDLYKNK